MFYSFSNGAIIHSFILIEKEARLNEYPLSEITTNSSNLLMIIQNTRGEASSPIFNHERRSRACRREINDKPIGSPIEEMRVANFALMKIGVTQQGVTVNHGIPVFAPKMY